MQVELSVIPPYLYAMYSIKSDDRISKKVKDLIRHVAAEEMLHASLVANLCVAVGYKPIFYSIESIPTYPNPLSHVKEGK